MHEEESPVEEVEHVGAVEHLEVPAPPHVGQGAGEHDGEDDDESYSSGVGESTWHTKYPWHGGEEPVHVAPPHPSLLRDAGLAVGDGQVDAHPVGNRKVVKATVL